MCCLQNYFFFLFLEYLQHIHCCKRLNFCFYNAFITDYNKKIFLIVFTQFFFIVNYFHVFINRLIDTQIDKLKGKLIIVRKVKMLNFLLIFIERNITVHYDCLLIISRLIYKDTNCEFICGI